MPPRVLSTDVTTVILSSFPSLSIFPDLYHSHGRDAVCSKASRHRFVHVFRLVPSESAAHCRARLRIRTIRLTQSVRVHHIPLRHQTRNGNRFLRLATFRPFRRAFCLRVKETCTVRKQSSSPRSVMRPPMLLHNFRHRRVASALRRASHKDIPYQVKASATDFHIQCVVTRFAVFRFVFRNGRHVAGHLCRDHVLSRRVRCRPRNNLTSRAQRLNGLSCHFFRRRKQVLLIRRLFYVVVSTGLHGFGSFRCVYARGGGVGKVCVLLAVLLCFKVLLLMTHLANHRSSGSTFFHNGHHSP